MMNELRVRVLEWYAYTALQGALRDLEGITFFDLLSLRPPAVDIAGPFMGCRECNEYTVQGSTAAADWARRHRGCRLFEVGDKAPSGMATRVSLMDELGCVGVRDGP